MKRHNKIPTMRNKTQGEKGIALLAVLWVIVLLMALATDFAFSMKTDVSATRNYKNDIEAYFLAKSGINLALAEIIRPALYHSKKEDLGFIIGMPVPPEEAIQPTDVTEENNEPTYEEPHRQDIEIGTGTVSYVIEDENGKIDINSASRNTLVKVLAQAGVPIGQDRDIIADSILDWIDANDTHLLNGAEDDYYRTLSPPYKAKNGPLETIEELLQIRGITPELFYGTEGGDVDFKGLINFFTTYKVKITNPNTMSLEVLPVFYQENQIQQILSARESKGFYANTTSTHFRITSTGKIDEGAEHTIVAVFEKTITNGRPYISTLFWDDNHYEK